MKKCGLVCVIFLTQTSIPSWCKVESTLASHVIITVIINYYTVLVILNIIEFTGITNGIILAMRFTSDSFISCKSTLREDQGFFFF